MDLIIREYEETDHRAFDLTFTNGADSTKNYVVEKALEQINPAIEKCFLAFLDTTRVGFIYGFVLPNKILLPQWLYVLPQVRKCGIGTALLKELEEKSKCTASMIFYNKDLHNYYSELGYETGSNLETAIKTINMESSQ